MVALKWGLAHLQLVAHVCRTLTFAWQPHVIKTKGVPVSQRNPAIATHIKSGRGFFRVLPLIVSILVQHHRPEDEVSIGIGMMSASRRLQGQSRAVAREERRDAVGYGIHTSDLDARDYETGASADQPPIAPDMGYETYYRSLARHRCPWTSGSVPSGSGCASKPRWIRRNWRRSKVFLPDCMFSWLHICYVWYGQRVLRCARMILTKK